MAIQFGGNNNNASSSSTNCTRHASNSLAASECVCALTGELLRLFACVVTCVSARSLAVAALGLSARANSAA